MTNTLVHPAAESVTEAEVISNEAYPLVRELAHAYKLQVIHKNQTADNIAKSHLYLVNEDGLCVGYVRFDRELGYVLRNVIVRKERGGRYSDSYYEYYSNKLPYLMRLIKKEKLIPSSSHELLNRDEMMLNCVPNSFAENFGDSRKMSELDGDECHQLLEIVFGNRSATAYSQESIENLKTKLDKYRGIDTIREKRRAHMQDVLGRNLWVVSYDLSNTFCVGKVKLDYQIDDNSYRPATFKDLSITQSFKRYKNLNEVPEIMPRMTMLKIHVEQTHGSRYRIEKDIFPIMGGTVPELDTVLYRAGGSWTEAPLKPNFIVFPSDS